MNDSHRGGHRHHKDLQVCRQVFDALTFAMAELDDPMIDELVVVDVVPAPNASRVLVTLTPARDDLDLDAALARVRELAAELREEVAAEVSRKHVPELVYRVVRREQLRDESATRADTTRDERA